ncbi:MAG: hypothetical protein N2486_05840 [Caloramator sp.]|nr:hypothetical protein [Caloramator sp.]
MKQIYERIYADFLKKPRFQEYENIIKLALEKGYVVTSVIDYYKNYMGKEEKVLILRHDIDSDRKGARLFFEIEKKYNVKASYYFRLSTLDYSLMDDIVRLGSEVGYHYEELAAYCKRNKIKSKVSITDEDLENIYNEFVSNLNLYFKNYDIKSIASHGDFYNRQIGVPNHYLFEKYSYTDLEIEVETYNKELLQSFDAYVSDARIRPFWRDGYSVIDAIKEDKKKVLFLSHPANWNRFNFDVLKENLKRLFESIYMI